MTGDSSFIHRYIPAAQPGLPTLLLLHGTGGDEEDLLPLGRMLLPGAGLLSPRGPVLENGMPRFFRRLDIGIFDLEDLQRRSAVLAAFIREAAEQYHFAAGNVIAAGYSNGANIAAALLLLHPGVLAGAALFHATVPLEPETKVDLSEIPVFISGGRMDPLVPAAETERLAEMLRTDGAAVTVHWEPGGHALARGEVAAAHDWLAGVVRER
ncbi:MAG TPA: alpha/beta hydrolase [Chloroflexota bacterium]|nr:alpha/beta hydrolase [Chloroflexota bacterium]